MSVSTVVRLNGKISVEQIISFLEQKFGMTCEDNTSLHVSEIKQEFVVYDNYNNSQNWESTYGHIVYEHHGEKSSLFYSYNNLNFHENYDYYKEKYPELIPMVEAETTYISHYCCDDGKQIVYAIAEEFGGWYFENDCNESAELIIGRIEKEQSFEKADFSKRDNMLERRIDVFVETTVLGDEFCSPIFQIKAIRFDIETGAIADVFDYIVDINNVENIKGSTLIELLKNDLLDNLVKKGIEDKLCEKDIIIQFEKWVKHFLVGNSTLDDIYLWSDSLFTKSILRKKFEQYNIEYTFLNDRDMQTVCELAAIKTGFESVKDYCESFPRFNTGKNKDEEIRFKIRILSKAYNAIIGRRKKK